MRRAVIATLLLVSGAAQAQESKSLVVDGKPGMWFPMETAKRMLADLTECQGKKTELGLVWQRLELEKHRTQLLEKNVVTTEQIATTWKSLAETQAKQLSNKDPWWKSPYLWSAVGFALGTGVTVGVTAAVGQLNK